MSNNFQEIHQFLGQLANNNTREWMTENKPTYQHTRKIFEGLVGQLIEGITLFDETISGEEAKKAIFRLNKDIRFSKDKTPYKLNYGASISMGGRKSPFASYYIHLMPGNNFLGAGMYQPQPDELKKIRQEIDYNTEEFLGITEAAAFKSTFGSLQGDRLKTAPKGYPKDHPQIEVLKHKGFFFLHNFEDEELGHSDFIARAVKKYQLIYPFVRFLNTAID